MASCTSPCTCWGGRSDAQKADLADAILGKIEPLLPRVQSVGVEIVDIHRASYRKRVLE